MFNNQRYPGNFNLLRLFLMVFNVIYVFTIDFWKRSSNEWTVDNFYAYYKSVNPSAKYSDTKTAMFAELRSMENQFRSTTLKGQKVAHLLNSFKVSIFVY